MYGLLRLPRSALADERAKYQRYMCSLCGALRQGYGVRARLLVNYDCATLALLMGSLSEDLDGEVMAVSLTKHPWCVLRSGKNPPKMMEFVASVSVMLAYAKFFDRSLDQNKKMPKWIVKLSKKASCDLAAFGLDRAFFEAELERQHQLERAGCNEMGLLSQPTAEILSKVFGVAVQIAAKPEYAVAFGILGLECGKLIYALDGLEDYQKDIKQGDYNCLYACSLSQKLDIGQISKKVNGLVQENRDNIATILNDLELKNSAMIKMIFLQDFISTRAQARQQTTCFAGAVAQGLALILLVSGSGGGSFEDTCLGKFTGGCLAPLCFCGAMIYVGKACLGNDKKVIVIVKDRTCCD